MPMELTIEQSSELLQEIFQVTLSRPLDLKGKDREKFLELLGALGQGASLEGSYNNLVSSSEYRKRMQNAREFSAKACKNYAELWGKLALPAVPDLAKQCESRRRTLWDLKQELSSRAIDQVDQKKADPLERARWYGGWAAELAQSGVDFGLKSRGLEDAEFHRQWALSVSEDLLKWEILNRIHRSLNRYEPLP